MNNKVKIMGRPKHDPPTNAGFGGLMYISLSLHHVLYDYNLGHSGDKGATIK